MATGKYSRVDGRRSSSCCSTVSVTVFVAVSLIGIWMLMSSSAVPSDGKDSRPRQEIASQVKQIVSDGFSKLFEDSSGDLPEDVMKEDGNTVDSQSGGQSEEGNAKETDEVEDKKEDTDKEPKDESKKETVSYDDGNSNNGDGESTTETRGEDGTDRNTKSEDEGGKNSDGGDSDSETNQEDKDSNQTEESSESTSEEGKTQVFPAGAQSELLSEANPQDGAWSTQVVESQNEKRSQEGSISKDKQGHAWKLCNVTAGADYIPCLDNWQAIRKLHSTKHYEHRERHCPEEAPTCLVRLPDGYRRSVAWPKSREKIWYYNVPHKKLAEVKGHQNWVKVTGEYLTFPGGGTQFKHGALHYIDFIEKSLPDIAWGKRSRVILDVGCGVASFGGFLFDRDVLAMSLAPKDEHEAQVQFALERGIPAILAVMGTKRLPFPSSVFDIVHCARCRVPWHVEGGKLLLELNRMLRPGGYFVWSATPVYQKLEEDVGIWKAMSKLTKSMCWEMVAKQYDEVNGVGVAIFRKPSTNECYEDRPKNDPPLCKESDDANAAWNVELEACIHRVPVDESKRGSRWPEKWPKRLEKSPYWLKSQVGVYGKAAPEDFVADYNHWKTVVSNSYLNGIGIDWSSVRNVMDMRAVYGGFAAALRDLKLWVMNVVPIDSADTLPIIYERGLFGMYHDWCESFNTYPRTYDLLHADHLFSSLRKRCNLLPVIVEVDRILRPEGKLIVRDDGETVNELEAIAKSMHWEVRMVYTKDNEGLLCVQKTKWRPKEQQTILSAIM